MPDTQDISARRANLSAEQRARLQQRLRGANTGASTAMHQAESTIGPRPHRDRAPLSFAQRRQWFLWKLDPARTAYHLSGGLVLTGALDTSALRASVQALVDRHESLRTVFREEGDGGAEQVIQEAVEISLPCIDLSALNTQALAQAVREEVQRIRTAPFDLTRGPLMRAVLLKTAPQAHQLLVVMHHIVSDGWSVQLSLDELASQYAARVQGRAPALPALPVQYADYAVWQNQWLDGGEGERQLAWWRDQLGSDQPVISLHTDRPRHADGRYGSARVTVAVPAATVARLRQQAQGQGATLFMALLAGFNAWLFRHTGQTDARVGVPIANRNRAETAGVVGFFVNTQVLRARIGARTTLAALLLQTRDAAIGAQTHQDLPFEQLVGALRPERSLSANPLFQVMFNHVRRDHRSLADWPGVSVERLDFEEEDAQFELTLQTLEFEDGRVEATFLYAAELFDRQTVERMAGHYLAVLGALAEQPELAVGDVALVGAAERAQLVAWSENMRVHEDAQPVHRQIEAHAKSKPLAPALVFGDEALSYAELNARANRLAHRLIALGVGPDVLVGICVERSTEMMVGIIAILKAGGAYVPLDPEYPSDRLAYMVEDSGISLLLTQSHLRSMIPGTDSLQVLELDTLDTASEPEADPQVPLHGEHLAYVIYTSGSTGRPKGAATRHAALFSCMAWMQAFYKLADEDTVLHKAPFGFDVSVWEMFWPLTSGAKLVIANPGDHRDPVRLVELIQQHQITTLNFVPSMLQAFLAYDGIEATTKLKHIICGGEAMPAATQKEALQRLSGATLQNLYGPTETTIHVTQWTCRDDGSTQVPIGRPISDTQAYVLDESLNDVPLGVAGELYLGGINLARGYLKRAALTAERFIAGDNGQRLYRTGDLVRWNSEGQLEYLGRIDHQVKVRGFRIELGEIEAQLQAQSEVREAVVVANEGPAGARLVGYVSGHAIDTTALRERLAEALPDYMVPSVIMVLDALPLNANGKVDRKALPAPEFTSEQAYEAPEGETEQMLSTIWADVLGVARVGRHDNFFALGGDSILSLKVTARAARAGVHLTPRQMFAHQSVARIAHALEAGRSAPVQAIPVLGAAQRAGRLALSHAQMRQWFLWQLDPQSTAYHISGALKLAGHLDAEALRACFDTLVQRHASLRTVFRADAQGLAEQIVQPVGRMDVSMLDLAALGSDTERDARSEQEALRVGHTPFDLGAGPLLRVGLIRLAAAQHMLVVVMHHIVSDGWSMQVLVDEFVALYRARVQGTAASLPALPIEYADYAAWQRDWLEAGERGRQLSYWTQQLGTDQPVLQLPTDHARKADGRYSAVRHGFDLPADLVRKLHKRLQAQGATLFMGLLAGFQVLLNRCTGEPDVRVGVPIANRHRAETAGVIGFFVNTQVLRNVLDRRETLSQVLARAKEAALGAQAHQDLPFEQLVEALQPERVLGANPLFQVMFAHQRGDMEALRSLPGLTLTECDLGAQAAQFELTLETTEHADGRVHANLRYASELFAPQTMARMASHYLAVLNALAEHPEQTVGDVALLGEEERAQLSSWGARRQAAEASEPIHRLIERQVSAQPGAAALSFDGQTLSYGELNARANRLAHRLIALGVKPETQVGIAVERSIEMVVGILAILKAGGAYVPLDPAYPADRLAYMVEDSGIAWLLTQSHLQVPGTEALRVLALDTLDLSAEPDTNPGVALHGEHLAYVIYTSGSTGRPKGAQLCHRNVSRLLDATDAWFNFNAGDVWTLFHSYAFDFSVWEMFGALCTGGRLVIVPFWVSRSPEDFLKLLHSERVTVLNQTPSAFGQLASLSGACEGGLALRTVIFGGEALDPRRLRGWIEHHGDDSPQLINMYGITETTVHVTYRRITAADLGQSRSPVGIAIPDLGLQVLDGQLNPTPLGVAGELYVSGAGLARGYLHRQGLTAERFIAADNGERLYRTGDLVKWTREGQLAYLGRIDHQVKVRGFRIELGEIEAQLLARREVREAVVIADEGPTGTRLVGYVSGQDIDTSVLRERLGDALPDHMVPALLIVLDALPLNANGKVERKALPAPVFTGRTDYEAPQGQVEETLAAIWVELLGVARVGRADNFFELGGDSVLSLQFAARARQQGVEVTPRQLFEHQSVAGIAKAVTGRQAALEASALPPLVAAPRADALVPSHAQARQWFLWQLDPDSTAYHISGALRLEGHLDLATVRAAFAALVARQEALRTVFRASANGLAEPVVLPPQESFALEVIDLAVGNAESEGEADTREAQAQQAAQRLAHTPFELGTGPLLRAGLIRLAPQQHVLVLVMHHIVSDGWSMQIVVDEFVAHYGALLSGMPQAAALPSLPLQYTDYAGWQRRWLDAGERALQLGYWTRRLGTEHPVLQLPTDHARVAGARYRAVRHEVVLPDGSAGGSTGESAAGLAHRLRQRAQAEGTTLFTVLLAGFQMLLSRYTGLNDIRVGVPVANRHHAGTENLVGFFVNTQVLRTVLGDACSLAEVLQQAHDAVRGAHAHQDLPFEQLVEALQPERSLGTSPLFQVLFNHQRADFRALDRLQGLTLADYPLGGQAAQFELSLDTREDAQGRLTMGFHYAEALFDARTIDRMASHYLVILEALADAPAQLLGELQLMTAGEREQLASWGGNPQHSGEAEPVHRLIERKAQRTPDATALVFGDKVLSYRELDARANRLAHWLIALGVKPEAKVGMALERSIEMVVGILATLKAGGAYVPLDPEYPGERLNAMVSDSGIALLLTQSHLRVPGTEGLQVLELDTLDLSTQPSHSPEVPLHGDNIAYVIYTSGSTGKPKGVANRHRSLHNRLVWMQQAYGLNGTDTVLQKTPFSFDVSVWEFLWPLMYGARLVVAAPGDHRDPERLKALICAHGVSTLHFVPSMLQAFMAHEGIETCTSVRRIVCSGEALSAQVQKAVFERLPRAALYNLYGPTEAAIDVTQWTCRDDGSTQVPIGRPISQTQARVLDAGLNEVPAGVAGELYLGGINLARGYLNRAGLTAERFVAAQGGERLYRTGDLVKWNAEGQLEYLGRIDHQVKVRGFRIELGEIEAQLQAQPEVREAVVVANEGPSGARLVGYVSGQDIDTAVLRDRLSEVLPDYMVPSVLMVLEALPLNANGKVDRKALPAPEFTGAQDYEAPQGEVEETLSAIWAEVLGVERVGRHDNFFELGGHSLLALQLLERMRAKGWSVQVRTLFQHAQLGAFAQAMLQEQGREEVVVPANGIPDECTSIEPQMLTLVELDVAQIRRIEGDVPGGAANIQDIYPLAPLQEGMLFHHLLQHEGDAYVTPHLLSFDSRERLARFVSSFDQVIERHDILRTAVLWEGLKEAVQVVLRKATLPVQWLDADKGEDSIENQLNAKVDPSHYRIDVRQAPMIRAFAAHDEENERWLLQLPSHHMVLDHTTLELLVQEIGLIQQGKASELPEPVPFRRYVAQSRLGVSRAEHEAFFTRMLGDVDEPTAPFNLLDVQGDGTQIEEARLPLEADLSARIRTQAQRHGVSAATLFHLAWALVLGKATGKDDVVFGTVLFGRMQGGEGAQRALGLFINTLPLRVKLGSRSVQQSLKETHASLTQLLHHEHASLSLAQRCSALPGGTPLFSAMLNYRYTPKAASADAPENPAWTGMQVVGGEERTNYPVTLSVDDLGDGFELVAQIDESVDASRVCHYMHEALAGIVKGLEGPPAQLLGELQLMTAGEREQLASWGDNPQHSGEAEPVHRLIERQAQRTPDATALVFGAKVLSYRELDARANRLAHWLIALGVKPEAKVGMALERSIEMVVGILATLKAGGAYVPLDPEYPGERLNAMVSDSGIALLLTQSHLRVPETEGLQVLELDTLDLSTQPSHSPEVPLHGDNIAYVIYTSGSTGKPKGVANRHRSLHNRLVWMQQAYGLDGTDTVLQKTPFSFDVSVWEFLWPLMYGARLVVAAPGDHRDPERLKALICAHGVSTLHFVPSMLQAFMAHEGIETCTSVRRIVCSGEALSAQAQKAVFERLPRAALYNLYGPTEAAIDVTQWTCRDDGSTQVPIGRPISQTQARVLDAGLNEVPAGVAGELYLGGINLARGYLNRAGLTAERFVATENGGRLYRTGDLVKWNGEGQLEYLGRIDHQVKVRGFRIELGEIEAQLQAQPEVREAVVVANEGSSGARLVGYVSGQDIDTAVLRDRLSEVLPDYMVPSVLMVMEALPLNTNGKVDRKALPAPEFTGGQDYEAPQGEVEETLSAIWAEVLGVQRVGRHDNFFELGGHSLLALRAVTHARLREHPELEASLQLLMAHPTVSGMALCGSASRPSDRVPLTLLNKSVATTAPLFCIHPGLGTVLGYLPLAQRLNGVRSVYGLACRTLTDPAHRDHSLAQMADDYVGFMRSVQPSGPYHLLGWSLGGALAALMAARLEAMGETVRFLGLVDSYVRLEGVEHVLDDWRTAFREFLDSMQMRLSEGVSMPSELRDPMAGEASLVNWTALQMHQGGLAVGSRYAEAGAAELVRIFMVSRSLAEATLRDSGRLAPVKAPVTCWWATGRPAQAALDLSRQMQGSALRHRQVAANHIEIVASGVVLDDVCALLRDTPENGHAQG